MFSEKIKCPPHALGGKGREGILLVSVKNVVMSHHSQLSLPYPRSCAFPRGGHISMTDGHRGLKAQSSFPKQERSEGSPISAPVGTAEASVETMLQLIFSLCRKSFLSFLSLLPFPSTTVAPQDAPSTLISISKSDSQRAQTVTLPFNPLTLSFPGKELVSLGEETKNAQYHTFLSLCLSDLPPAKRK